MKNQALFSLKDKSKKINCHLLQFLIGILRVKSHLKGLRSFLPLCLFKVHDSQAYKNMEMTRECSASFLIQEICSYVSKWHQLCKSCSGLFNP